MLSFSFPFNKLFFQSFERENALIRKSEVKSSFCSRQKSFSDLFAEKIIEICRSDFNFVIMSRVLSISYKRCSALDEQYPLNHQDHHITAPNGILIRLNHNAILCTFDQSYDNFCIGNIFLEI